MEDKQKAGFVIRGGAYLVDSILIGVPLYIVLNLFFQKKETENLLGLLFLGYYFVMTVIYGATLGKKYFGLKVVRTNGEKLGWGRVLLRETLGRIVSSFLGSLGYFWVIWDKNKQSWHDKMAGTIVIQDIQVSKGKNIFAHILVLLLPIFFILGIVLALVLMAINPAKQFEKARESQKQIETQKVMTKDIFYKE